MRTILVVDDDPVSVSLIEMIATRSGFACQAASSGAEALAWLESSTSVEMVITDQNMPGMSGLELYSKVHADPRFRHLPFILCTGSADRTTVGEAVRLGIQHFIVKPITPKVVLEKVLTVEAAMPQAIEPRSSIMVRLGLSDLEYRNLILTSRQQIAGLRDGLAKAYSDGDRVETALFAERLREPANLLAATRLLAAIDLLERSSTWHGLEDAVAGLFLELGTLDNALDIASKPQLMGRLPG
jgi:CheY-like chemotaxis protein